MGYPRSTRGVPFGNSISFTPTPGLFCNTHSLGKAAGLAASVPVRKRAHLCSHQPVVLAGSFLELCCVILSVSEAALQNSPHSDSSLLVVFQKLSLRLRLSVSDLCCTIFHKQGQGNKLPTLTFVLEGISIPAVWPEGLGWLVSPRGPGLSWMQHISLQGSLYHWR